MLFPALVHRGHLPKPTQALHRKPRGPTRPSSNTKAISPERRNREGFLPMSDEVSILERARRPSRGETWRGARCVASPPRCRFLYQD
eukprot:1395522-Amorphochlora_amoeboformis.AAC.1